MINEETLNILNSIGFGADIDGFETYVMDLRDAYGEGKPLVDDSQYDVYHRILKEVKPESKVFEQNWELEETELGEYDQLLDQYGMSSIRTIQGVNERELEYFAKVIDDNGGKVSLFASIKENGHAFRAVYLNGKLHYGTTRGRYKKGRDITRHLKRLLPNYIEDWKDSELVELRGELLVKLSTFEEKLQGELKTPLSSVTSLIRDSATDNEIDLMSAVCFKILTNSDSLHFDCLRDEFEHLQEQGFETPQSAVIQGVTRANLIGSVNALLEYFEDKMDNGELEYSCDGIVVAIDDNHIFYNSGRDGNTWNGNFAVKSGKYWESNIYSAVIEEVVFIPGKTYMTPKAIIEPTVCSNGAEVKVVPLYNVGVMERYGYTPGETVFFRFGGEQGVTCCDYEGKSVQV